MQNEIQPEIVAESPIRWSDSIEELAKALPEAQKALKPLETDATNKHFGRDYASLGAALEACLTAYNDHGFSVIQIPTVRNGLVCITTRLLHVSAEWMEADLLIRPENETAQKVGTAATYGRRYSLTSIAGLAPVEEAPTATEAVTQAKSEGKRLTKAMARDLFEKMQGGLRNQSSANAVRKWLTAFDDELKSLPVDQEKELRTEAEQEIEGHESAKTPELEGAGF
jgi:hypothetical protein